MRGRGTLAVAALVLLLAFCAQAQDDEGFASEREAATKFAVRQLADGDSLVRQRAAEVLAKYSAIEHQRLVEGYRLQEKNERVRLAIDWALYRMGKNNALYGVVRQLKSDSRRPQAVGYLSQLVDPQLLYPFLDRAESKTLVGLFEVMAAIGDAETLELIKPYRNYGIPEVESSAEFALREIALRLAQPKPDAVTRPREVRESP
jgi:HEAT repeat protein